MSQPWLKFYPSDWRADQALRVCSLAARGLWIELMCVMHESDPYGHLLINGRPVTVPSIAALTGANQDQIGELLGELEAAGVFSRNRAGVIYSRRMTRDEKRARVARINGRGGGNPSLCNQSGNTQSDNPSVNPADNPSVKPQIPERDSESKRSSESGFGDADASSDLDALFYRRGKKLLGNKAGGQLTKLRGAVGLGAALEVIDQAQHKESPAEYVAAVIRSKGSGHAGQAPNGGHHHRRASVVEAGRRVAERADRLDEERAYRERLGALEDGNDPH